MLLTMKGINNQALRYSTPYILDDLEQTLDNYGTLHRYKHFIENKAEQYFEDL